MNFNNLISSQKKKKLNLFVFELLFKVIGDMLFKLVVKFVVFLASLFLKSTNYLKNAIKFWASYIRR